VRRRRTGTFTAAVRFGHYFYGEFGGELEVGPSSRGSRHVRERGCARDEALLVPRAKILAVGALGTI
jgi:hypothetical protein